MFPNRTRCPEMDPADRCVRGPGDGGWIGGSAQFGQAVGTEPDQRVLITTAPRRVVPPHPTAERPGPDDAPRDERQAGRRACADQPDQTYPSCASGTALDSRRFSEGVRAASWHASSFQDTCRDGPVFMLSKLARGGSRPRRRQPERRHTSCSASANSLRPRPSLRERWHPRGRGHSWAVVPSTENRG